MKTDKTRKIFACNQIVYEAVKQDADLRGLHYSRYVENAIANALKGTTGKETDRTAQVIFWCNPVLYEKAKKQARAEGVYFARWLETACMNESRRDNWEVEKETEAERKRRENRYWKAN